MNIPVKKKVKKIVKKKVLKKTQKSSKPIKKPVSKKKILKKSKKTVIKKKPKAIKKIPIKKKVIKKSVVKKRKVVPNKKKAPKRVYRKKLSSLNVNDRVIEEELAIREEVIESLLFQNKKYLESKFEDMTPKSWYKTVSKQFNSRDKHDWHMGESSWELMSYLGELIEVIKFAGKEKEEICKIINKEITGKAYVKDKNNKLICDRIREKNDVIVQNYQNYLTYWKQVYSKRGLPLFSRFNNETIINTLNRISHHDDQVVSDVDHYYAFLELHIPEIE